MVAPRFSIWQIVRQSLPMIYVVMMFSMLTGATFDHALSHVIRDIPAIIIVIPAFINLTGDLSDVFASRLTSAMYKGEISHGFQPLRLFLSNLLAILAVAFTSFFFTALLGNLIGSLLFHQQEEWKAILLTVILAGSISTTIMCLIAAFLVKFTIQRGIDPDSTISPLTTTGGDLLGTSLLLIFALLFLK